MTTSSAIKIRTYRELEQFAEAFASGNLNLLILVGSAGLAKSQTIRRTVGSRVCWLEGNATAFGMYSELAKAKNKLVVIDDVDSLYGDRAAVRLLKSLCKQTPLNEFRGIQRRLEALKTSLKPLKLKAEFALLQTTGKTWMPTQLRFAIGGTWLSSRRAKRRFIEKSANGFLTGIFTAGLSLIFT